MHRLQELRARQLLLPAMIFLAACAYAALAWIYLMPLGGLEGIQSRVFYTGDYSTDADASLLIGMHGKIFSMYGVTPVPLMMPIALLVRLPFLLIADLTGIAGLDPGDLHLRYAVGALVMTALAAGVVMAAAALRAHRFGKAKLSILVIGAVFALNPIAIFALRWAHPEELLMAALMMAALFAAASGRYRLAAVSLALACATKQPAVLLIPTALLLIPAGERKRATLWFIGSALLASVPFIIADIGSFIGAQFSAGTTVGSYYDTKDINFFDFAGLHSISGIGRPIIYITAIALPLLIARRDGYRLAIRQAAYIAAFVFFVRCYFDSYNIVYYAAPMIGLMLVFEWESWREGSWRPVRWAKARKLPFLPVISFALAVWINAITGGEITTLAADYVSGKDHLVYGLAAGTTLLAFIPGLLGKRWNIDRSRMLLYGTAAVAVFGVLVAIVITFKPSKEGTGIGPVLGMQKTTVEHLAAVNEEPVYYLSEPPAGGELRFAAMPGEKADPKARTLLGAVDYGPHDDGVTGVTIFTKAADRDFRAVYGKLVRCERRDSCERVVKRIGMIPTEGDNFKVVDTAVGPAVEYANAIDGSAEAQLFTPRGQLIYMIGSGADGQEQLRYIEAALDTIERIPEPKRPK